MNIYTSHARSFPQIERQFTEKGYQKETSDGKTTLKDGRVYVKACDFSLRLSACAKRLLLCKIVFETIFSFGLCWIARSIKEEWSSYRLGRRSISVYQSQEEFQREKSHQKILDEYRKESNYYRQIDDSLLTDHVFMLKAVEIDPTILKVASDAIRADRAIALKAVQTDAFAFTMISTVFRGDKEIVLEAVRKDGSLLCFASDKLRNDRDVVLAAVTESGLLKFASERLQADTALQILSVRKDSKQLHLYPALENNPAACQEFGIVKPERLVVAKMPSDAEQIAYLNQVKTDKKVLATCPIQLLNDRNFMLLAITVNPGAYRYASAELKKDRELALLAVKTNIYILVDAPPEIRDDKEIVLAALDVTVDVLRFASDRLKSDFDVLFKAVSKKTSILDFASDSIKGNPKIMAKALSKDPASYIYTPDSLRSDKELALYLDSTFFCFTNDTVKDDPAVVLKILAKEADAYESVSPRLKKTRDFVLEAVKVNPLVFDFIDEQFTQDDQIARIAVLKY